MTTTTTNTDFLEELSYFENFLNSIGFKRAEGSIYGLLVLSPRPLSSEEIQNSLGLSQSAVSLGLKNLSHYGAIETKADAKTKYHSAKSDSLSIVATVFRKREQPQIEEYRLGAERILDQLQSLGIKSEDLRIKKLKSNINTSKIAEAVMRFVIELSKYEHTTQYQKIVDELPRVLNLLIKGEQLAHNLVTSLYKVKDAQKKWFQQGPLEKDLEQGLYDS